MIGDIQFCAGLWLLMTAVAFVHMAMRYIVARRQR